MRWPLPLWLLCLLQLRTDVDTTLDDAGATVIAVATRVATYGHAAVATTHRHSLSPSSYYHIIIVVVVVVVVAVVILAFLPTGTVLTRTLSVLSKKHCCCCVPSNRRLTSRASKSGLTFRGSPWTRRRGKSTSSHSSSRSGHHVHSSNIS